jgi:2-C-methyl-D-erythritol 4-phosphate cytidylyltransferase
MKLAVIIPAAGGSTRFGFGDKLSQDIEGRAVLLRSIECFTKREETTAIIVAAPPDELDGFKDRFGAQLGFHGAQIIEGGRNARWESVQAALAFVPDDATHIAVHDAARPNVSQELIDRVLDAARIHDAVLPGVRMTSTLKRVCDESVAIAQDDPIADAILGGPSDDVATASAHLVATTIDRENLVAAQTPQVFTRAVLMEAYASADEATLNGATDDATLVEALGKPVVVVEGDPRNLKITTADDLAMLKRLSVGF